MPDIESGGVVEAIADALHRTDHLLRTPTWHRRLTGVSGVDLGRSGYSILTSLENDGAQRLTDLAEEFGLDQSTVSRRIATLERHGFVERQADDIDGRVSRVSLSPTGRTALHTHRTAIIMALAELIGDWPDDQRQALADSMSRLADDLGTTIRGLREGTAPADPRAARSADGRRSDTRPVPQRA